MATTISVNSFVYMAPDSEEDGVRYFMPDDKTVQVDASRVNDHSVAQWILNSSPIRPVRSEHVARDTWDGVVVEGR